MNMPELEATRKVFEQKEEERISDLARHEAAQKRQDERWAANKVLLAGLQEQVAELGLGEKLGDVAKRMQGEYASFQLLSVNWADTYGYSPQALSGFVIAKHYTGPAWPKRNRSDYYFQAVLLHHKDQDMDLEGNPIPLPSEVEIAIGSVSDSDSYDGGKHIYEKIAQEGERANVSVSSFFNFDPKLETIVVREMQPVKGLIFTKDRLVAVNKPHVTRNVGSFRVGSEPYFPEQKDRYMDLLDKRLASFVAKEHKPRVR
jgi:hypothetical protein